MKHQKLLHRFTFSLTLLSLFLVGNRIAFAEDPASICQRLPAIPSPQTTSSLRLFAAYLTPTIIAQFGTSANQTDYTYQNVVNDRSQTLRDFTRAAQPYNWEISLFWNLSRLPEERTLTPLTEAFQHQEYQLREAYRICRELRKYAFQNDPDTKISNINNTTSMEQILSELDEQRITALLRIYSPKILNYDSVTSTNAVFATGVTP